MERPALPGWWRWCLAPAALVLLLPALLSLPASGAWLFLNDVSGVFFLALFVGGGTGLALAVGLARAGRRERVVLAATSLALLVPSGLWGGRSFAALAWLTLAPAFSLLLARPHRVATPLAVGGLLGTFALSVARALVEPSRPFDARADAWELATLAAGLAASVGLVAYAALARTPGARLSWRASAALLAIGVALLAASWLLGGHFAFVPIWPLGPALVLAAGLAAARGSRAIVAALALVALIGAAPAGTCTQEGWSDTGATSSAPERVSLVEVGSIGPHWASGDGFGGVHVRCGPATLALGAVWMAALFGAGLFALARSRDAW